MEHTLRQTDPPVRPRAGITSNSRSPSTGARMGIVSDVPTFEDLYIRFRPLVEAICRRMLHNKDLVEDIVQDVFVDAFRSLSSFRSSERMEPWIATIAKRRCIDEMRRKYRFGQEEPAGLFFETGTVEDAFEKVGIALDARQVLASLAPALRRLTDRQRYAILCIGIDGWSSQEISEALGIEVVSARTLVLRARVKIREYLEAHGDIRDEGTCTPQPETITLDEI